MTDRHRREPEDEPLTEEPTTEPSPEATAQPGETSKPLTLRGSFGTVAGASMLGLEQALRDGPPPQIQAAEHMPARGGSGQDDDLVIEFPGPPPREDPGTKDGER